MTCEVLRSIKSADEFVRQWPRPRGFTAATGLHPAVFCYVFNKYCRGTRECPAPFCLYEVFVWLKLYPPLDCLGMALGDVGQSPTAATRRIKARMRWLSARLNELHLADAFDSALPAGWFPAVVGAVDGLPVYCNAPSERRYPAEFVKSFHSGKYNAPCVKFELTTNNSGVPIAINGPYPGTMHDAAMWAAHDGSPFRGITPMPMLLGDAGYVGCEGTLAPCKRPKKGELTAEQHLWNRGVQWWRATVEHTIGYIKRFAIIGGQHRGRLGTVRGRENLFAAFRICTSVSAIVLRLSPRRRLNASLLNLNKYLRHLEAKGDLRSRYDVARDKKRAERLAQKQRAEAKAQARKAAAEQKKEAAERKAAEKEAKRREARDDRTGAYRPPRTAKRPISAVSGAGAKRPAPKPAGISREPPATAPRRGAAPDDIARFSDSDDDDEDDDGDDDNNNNSGDDADDKDEDDHDDGDGAAAAAAATAADSSGAGSGSAPEPVEIRGRTRYSRSAALHRPSCTNDDDDGASDVDAGDALDFEVAKLLSLQQAADVAAAAAATAPAPAAAAASARAPATARKKPRARKPAAAATGSSGFGAARSASVSRLLLSSADLSCC